jgi:hypothetical protein
MATASKQRMADVDRYATLSVYHQTQRVNIRMYVSVDHDIGKSIQRIVSQFVRSLTKSLSV